MSTIGERIIQWRGRRGWSQSELARQAGLSQGNISRIEAGIGKMPYGETLAKIASALGITVDELQGAPPPVPADDPELLRRLTEIPCYSSFPAPAQHYLRDKEARWLAQERADTARIIAGEETVHVVASPTPAGDLASKKRRRQAS